MATKHPQLARLVGESASSPANSMAESSDANTVPEGTTYVFGSWACTADGSGGFCGHLIAPKEPETKLDDQTARTDDAPRLGGNQVLLEPETENIENM